MRTSVAVASRRTSKSHGLDWRAVADSPADSAEAAGLVYADDARPGIRRRRAGRGFVYLGPRGQAVKDEPTLARIRALAVPPAWTDVWISPIPNGHIQASGRDQKGRKQYRYHARWRAVRDETKFDRMLAFGAALPRIRAAVERDLSVPALPRCKVLATVVSLLERTLVRVGNEEYARSNDSYGLTTLREDHVDITGERLRFGFRGKAGKEHVLELHDRRLARIVGQCQSIPGQELFQYRDEGGERQTVSSDDVNAYLREVAGDDFTAKDFRTWAATVLAARRLRDLPAVTRAQAKRNVVATVKWVAERLGNTPGVCKKSYIHPAVLETHVSRAAGQAKAKGGGKVRRLARELARSLAAEEAELCRTLERLPQPVADAVVVDAANDDGRGVSPARRARTARRATTGR